MWNINWVKASEIIFDALLTGIISAVVVLITYRLGKWQSDNNWKREIDRREKERHQEEQREHNRRCLSIMDDLLIWKEKVYTGFSEDILRTNALYPLGQNEIGRILHTVRRAKGLYQNIDNKDIHNALENLIELTGWNWTTKQQIIKERRLIIDRIFITLEQEYQTLESLLRK